VKETVPEPGNIPVHVIVPVTGNAGFLVARAAVFPAVLFPFVLFKAALDGDYAAPGEAFPEAPPFFPEQPEIKILSFSVRLRIIVHDLDISQTKFASSLGVSFTWVNCLINGKRGNISQSLALLIQQLYGYPTRWIFYEEGDGLKKVIRRTLYTRPQLIGILNAFTREEIDLSMEYIKYHQ
jgi:transcriptional regulator with XRE-family HTH domain